MPTLQAVKTFSQGLNQDLSPMNVPESAYVDALNITTFDKGGNQFSISNERGFQAKQALPSGYRAIGLYYIDNKIVCFSYNETTQASQIGYYDINTFVYTRVFDDKDLTQQFNSSQTFDFSPDYQIRATGRVAFNGDIYIYWVDGKNPPRWINLSRNYFANRFIDLNSETSLFSGSALVEIDLAGILESGNLTASSYQFAVRYQSDTGDTTPFSPLCNPIPIVDELQSVGRDLYTGAGQTENKGNKSIELSLSNVDTAYRFIQLAAVHYEGNALTPVIYIIDNIPITGSSFNYTYSGSESSSTTITTQELIQERAIYSTANQITQKNNRLFVGNLKETGIGESLQTIANSIQIKYKIEEIQVTSAFTDYKLEENTFNKKGYRRDEAYAFGIAFVYTSGGISPVFHIPGPASGNATRDIGTTDSNAEGTLGSTVTSNTSGTSYPGFGGYPSGKVRHHKMPSLQTEPSFRNDSGDVYIRIFRH
ncbi:MAG: hypothetical protein HC836_47200 [Richelia sp. RM2_1_2]|nr:hypothetical protein [Richelia sp. RM2_1_2]